MNEKFCKCTILGAIKYIIFKKYFTISCTFLQEPLYKQRVGNFILGNYVSFLRLKFQGSLTDA
jgi:hypothetical protein